MPKLAQVDPSIVPESTPNRPQRDAELSPKCSLNVDPEVNPMNHAEVLPGCGKKGEGKGIRRLRRVTSCCVPLSSLGAWGWVGASQRFLRASWRDLEAILAILGSSSGHPEHSSCLLKLFWLSFGCLDAVSTPSWNHSGPLRVSVCESQSPRYRRQKPQGLYNSANNVPTR